MNIRSHRTVTPHLLKAAWLALRRREKVVEKMVFFRAAIFSPVCLTKTEWKTQLWEGKITNSQRPYLNTTKTVCTITNTVRSTEQHLQRESCIIYTVDIRAFDDADKPNGMTSSPKSLLQSMKTELQDNYSLWPQSTRLLFLRAEVEDSSLLKTNTHTHVPKVGIQHN